MDIKTFLTQFEQEFTDFKYMLGSHHQMNSPEHIDDLQEALNQLHYTLHQMIDGEGLQPLVGCSVTTECTQSDPWARFDEEEVQP